MYIIILLTEKSQTICEDRAENLRVSLEKARLPHRDNMNYLVYMLNNSIGGLIKK